MVKDKNGELKKIRVDPSTVKHYKTDMVLGPAGQVSQVKHYKTDIVLGPAGQVSQGILCIFVYHIYGKRR